MERSLICPKDFFASVLRCNDNPAHLTGFLHIPHREKFCIDGMHYILTMDCCIGPKMRIALDKAMQQSSVKEVMLYLCHVYYEGMKKSLSTLESRARPRIAQDEIVDREQSKVHLKQRIEFDLDDLLLEQALVFDGENEEKLNQIQTLVSLHDKEWRIEPSFYLLGDYAAKCIMPRTKPSLEN